MTRVLSIDPGYDRLGIAILARENGLDTLLHSECFMTDRTQPLARRIREACDRVAELMTSHQPTLVALERLYFNKNQKTAMGVAEVRGALTYLAESRGFMLREYTPQEVKIAITGYGRSDKGQVARMLPKLLKNVPHSALDDEYDAIAIGVTALASFLSTR